MPHADERNMLTRHNRLQLRQRLHENGSVWDRYEIDTDKSCVYTGPGGSGTDRICYLEPNESTYEGDTNGTVPFQFRTGPE